MKISKRFIILICISLFVMAVATFLTYSSSVYIHNFFGTPPVVKDWLWEKLPYFKILWLAEILMIFSIILGCYFCFKENKLMLPYAIIIASLFHILRAGLIILTPLSLGLYSGLLPYGKDSIFLFGAFPSGHLAVPYLIFMISKKKIFLLLTAAIAIILLVSHAHYSIDLIGTLLLGYPLFKFSEKYIGRYFKDEGTNQ